MALGDTAYHLYTLAARIAAPPSRLWIAAHKDYGPLVKRFAQPPVQFPERPIWVQACSVGEVGTAKPIIAALRKRHPHIPVLLTASTITGHKQAESVVPDVTVSWFPVDHPGIVRRFLRAANPRALVLIETELWPVVLHETARAQIPIILFNGRISDKHFKRYTRVRNLIRPLFESITAAGMQNEEYAQRLTHLGTPPERIHITGCTKFDGVKTHIDESARAALRRQNGFPPQSPILLFGSTRPGDEALAAQCWRALRSEFPDLRLIIAPRHIDRIEEALAPFDEPILRRSAIRDGQAPASERVFALDTIGELASFYALATVAVIGGSFFPGVNGHNPLESAAMGIPTVFGPYMRNFIDPARVLLECSGALQIDTPGKLPETLGNLLQDPPLREDIGARGRAGILENQGAIGRNLQLLETAAQLGAQAT